MNSTLKTLIKKNRSYRRFNQSTQISKQTLTELVDLARLSASGKNQQSLKYILSYTEETNQKVFPQLSWAGYLTDWNGPIEEEHPSAYIICLHDKTIADTHFCDEGIAAQSILLGAIEKGLGGCLFWSIKREELRKTLAIPEQYKIVQVIALGEPIEQVVIDEIQNDDYKYWRDKDEVHHVPKRGLDEIIVEIDN